MAGGMKWIGLAGAVLATAGCAFPLELAVDAWSWGEYWNQAGGESRGEAGGEVRGSGDLVTESRAVARFHAVSASGPLRVVVERSGRDRVSVTAEESLLPLVESEVHGGVLHVGPRRSVSLAPWEEIVVHVECVEVVDVSGSGAAVLDVDLGWLPELWISLGGGATLTAQGEAERLHATLSGASSLDALDLRSEHADASVSGASKAWVWVRDRLDVEAGGASHVRFRGSPVMDARVAATSSVTRY